MVSFNIMQKKLFTISWTIAAVCLFLYSYTQVDLSLTLSQVSIYQTVEKWFQYVGYFNRPLSTYLYIGIIAILFYCYIVVLKLVSEKKITKKQIWILTLITAGILVFSYNAFSYDLFNYIFDAKIITHYHQNPYVHKALDFPGEPMLSFMHWTQRTYPYGPIWLLVTVPLSFIGMNYFLLTFFLFKGLAAVSFLVTTYFIEKISRLTKNIPSEFAMAAFAFNPLVIFESLVSAHNDIVMMAFIMVAVYVLFTKKNISAWIMLLLSAGIKFATAFIAPVFVWFHFQKKKNEKTYELFFLSSAVLMSVAVIVASIRTNFQPWYLIEVLPFAALIAHKKYILIPLIVLSIGSLIQYIPFLYTGNWDPPIPTILLIMLVSSIIVSIIGIGTSYMSINHKNQAPSSK